MSAREKHIIDPDIPLIASIIVISDSLTAAGGKRWRKLDTSAKKAEEILSANKIPISNTFTVPDEKGVIQESISNEIEKQTSLVITIGGTGISSRDVTIEAIKPLLEKVLVGYGELFRNKTYEEVGTVSIMTRALAGVTRKSCIVCLPGSTNAVQLGINLILKELIHIMNLRR
ncbi:MAG: MogA/MoaB family molybdenum cofactor biosynthesis protein [Candidatus Hodarchaeales archaeon]